MSVKTAELAIILYSFISAADEVSEYMQELRKCIEDFIDVYGVVGLKDERKIRNFIRQNPCGGEAGKNLLLHAVKRIPELAESGMDRDDISAAVIEELAFSQNPSKAAEGILQYLIGLLYEFSAPPKADEPKPDSSKADEPKPAPPKTDEPKPDSPKADEPKPAPPKAVDPKPEPPKAEEPKPESPGLPPNRASSGSAGIMPAASVRDTPCIDPAAMRKAVKESVEQFGPEILLDKARFRSAILDLLPHFSYREERDWLFFCVDMLNIGSSLLKAVPGTYANVYRNNFEMLQKRGINAKISDVILQAFTGALNWNVAPLVSADEIVYMEPPVCKHGDIDFVSRRCRLCNQNLYGIFDAGKYIAYEDLKKEEKGGVLFSLGDYSGTLALPEHLKGIGDYALSDRGNLLEVIFPLSLTSIGKFAFEKCSSLKSLELPDSLTVIGEYAFADCTSLRSVRLPGALRTIEEGAFSGCSELKLKAPASVVSIGEDAFAGVKQVSYSGTAAGSPWGAQKFSEGTSASDSSADKASAESADSGGGASGSNSSSIDSLGVKDRKVSSSEETVSTSSTLIGSLGSSDNIAHFAEKASQSGRKAGLPKTVYILSAVGGVCREDGD